MSKSEYEIIKAFNFPLEEGESSKAYDAKLQYVKMGAGRSLGKLLQALGKSKGYIGQLERWSSTYKWVDLAAQFDKHRAKMIEEAELDELLELTALQRKFRVQLSLQMQEVTVLALNRLKQVLLSGEFVPSLSSISRLALTADQLRGSVINQHSEIDKPDINDNVLEAIQNVYANNDDEETADES